jgi:rhodanese-related sulfurtransferase
VLYRLSDDNVLTLFVVAAAGGGAQRGGDRPHRAAATSTPGTTWSRVPRDAAETPAATAGDGTRRSPADEFAVGHVPGALNVPLEMLEQRSGARPGQEIVAYCRGAYCVLSFEAVAALRERGFTVHRLEEGFPEWRAAGLPVETGA